MRDFSTDLATQRDRLAEAEGYLGLDHLQGEHARLEVELSRQDLWDHAEEARKVGTEYASVKDDLDSLGELAARIEDAETLYGLSVEEQDDSVESELEAALADIRKRLDGLELRSLFSGEYDVGDAIFEVNSGAGGVDAQDWAEMLLRMYQRWAEAKGFSVEVDDIREGNEAGITSATLIIRGRYVYGLLAAERGVHRLVRISPFDSQARRQTGFASVAVTPMIDEASESELEVPEKELRIDTYRATGAGGQHINTTDSAVRITHLPTGVVVSCQNERSQIQNRAKAMLVLKAKLLEKAREDRETKIANITGPQKDAAWGNQIRSYVLAPYQMVKDHRSNYETGNVQAVIDGDVDALEAFMEAWLRWRRTPDAGEDGRLARS